MLVSGVVEEGQEVPAADVEEEVAGALVVTVLEDLDEREAEKAVVEVDGALDVGADQRHVVDAVPDRRRPLPDPLLPDPRPSGVVHAPDAIEPPNCQENDDALGDRKSVV